MYFAEFQRTRFDEYRIILWMKHGDGDMTWMMTVLKILFYALLFLSSAIAIINLMI